MSIAEGTFSLKCDLCGTQHDFLAEDADFDCIATSEEPMGPDNLYCWNPIFNCDCEKEIEVTYEVSEYPAGVFNNETVKIDGGTEVNRFTFDFSEGPDED